jgi:alkylation response protein AidB-like acyl-CoA dehydrogenase
MTIANNICRKAMVRTLLTRWHSNGIAAANHSMSRRFSSSVVHHDHDTANDHGEEMPRRMPVTKFTEDEEMVRDAARTWANQEMRPYVREMDDNCQTRPELIQSLFHNGFMGMEIPVQYGGSGMNFTSACLVVEELSRVDPSVSILVDIHNTLTNNAVRFWGTEQLKDKWLPRLASSCVSSFALSEAGSGTDAFAMKTTATPSTDGSFFTLNGEKLWISNAIEAGVFLVFANANPSLKHKGITAFMVDANTEGVVVGKPEKKLGLRASRTCPVVFDNVKVDATDVLGDVGLGYKYCINILNEGRIGIASQQIGVSLLILCNNFIICPHPFDLYVMSETTADCQGLLRYCNALSQR